MDARAESVRLATIFAPRKRYRKGCIEWGLVPSKRSSDNCLAVTVLNRLAWSSRSADLL